MVAVGLHHMVLLRSDGRAIPFGVSKARELGTGHCDFPPLPEGMSYVQVATGAFHTVLLRSDGRAVACGVTGPGRRGCKIPPLPQGLSYTQVAANYLRTALIRSDGRVLVCPEKYDADDGEDEDEIPLLPEADIPPLPEGVSYTQVSLGERHTVLLRSDGRAVACGDNGYRKCEIPPLPESVLYTQVSAAGEHTVLLRSDGTAVATGPKSFNRSRIPPLQDGLQYIEVSAGIMHTLLLRSDGEVVVCGPKTEPECKIPRLSPGVSYTQVCAGTFLTGLLRSDGRAVACSHLLRDIDIRDPPPGKWYIEIHMPQHGARVLQLSCVCEDDVITLCCSTLAGEEVLRVSTRRPDLAWDAHKRIAREMKTDILSLKLVLPDGRLLTSICRANPRTTIQDVIPRKRRRLHGKQPP